MTIVFAGMVGRICAFFVLSAKPVLVDHATHKRTLRTLNEADHDNFPSGGTPAVPEDHATRSRRALRGVLPHAGRRGAPALERRATNRVRVGARAAARHEVRGLSRARRMLRSGWTWCIRAVQR